MRIRWEPGLSDFFGSLPRQVKDTFTAHDGAVRKRIRFLRLGWKAKLAEKRRSNRTFDHIVTVTGSVGKSTTTRLLGEIARSQGVVHVGSGSNNPDGIRGAFLKCPTGARIWVQETSGHNKDAINSCLQFIQPNIAIVTRIGMDHISSLGSMENIAAVKGLSVEALPADGTAVLNLDDPLVAAMKERTAAKTITFGEHEQADIRLVHASFNWPERLNMIVEEAGHQVAVHSNLIGMRWTTSLLAAIAGARAMGIPLEVAASAVTKVQPEIYKDSLHEKAGVAFILDCFKAGYWTIPSSIATPKAAKAVRKVAVIGTISDYKGAARPKYVETAKLALDAADIVIFFGHHAQRVRRLLPDYPDRLFMFETYAELAQFFSGTARQGDLVYVKSSHSDHLERIWHNFEKPVTCEIDHCGKLTTCNHCKYLYRRHWRKRAPNQRESRV